MTTLLILLALLAAPQFRVREAATSALSPANSITLPFLLWSEKHHPSPEGRRRSQGIVDRWYAANADRLAAALGRLPWIDRGICGWLDFLAEARIKTGTPGSPHWPDYAEGCRLWVRDRIAARLPYQGELRRLWLEEWQYRFWRQGEWWCW